MLFLLTIDNNDRNSDDSNRYLFDLKDLPERAV